MVDSHKDVKSRHLSRRPSLHREGSFYQHAWVELHSTLMEIQRELIQDYGFKVATPAANGEPIFLLDLFRVDPSQVARVPMVVQLPTDLESVKDVITQYEPQGSSIEIKMNTLNLRFSTFALEVIPPLNHLLHILTSLLPLHLAEINDRYAMHSEANTVRVTWLARNEELVRNTMGDSHFRHLHESLVRA